MKSATTLMRWLVILTCLNVFSPSSDGGSTNRMKAEYRLLCESSHNYMLQDFDSGQTSIISPNRRSQIFLAKDFSLKVVHNGQVVGAISSLTDIDSNMQMMWAPDSEKFSITYSDSGAEGAFHVHIYKVSASGLAEFTKPPPIAFDDFKKKYYCKIRGNNISALGWTADSRLVLLVTEVFDTSDCGPIWGKEGGYLMDLDGKIIHRYDDKQTNAIQKTCERAGRMTLQ